MDELLQGLQRMTLEETVARSFTSSTHQQDETLKRKYEVTDLAYFDNPVPFPKRLKRGRYDLSNNARRAQIRPGARRHALWPQEDLEHHKDYTDSQCDHINGLPHSVLENIIVRCSPSDSQSLSGTCRSLQTIVIEHAKSTALVELNLKYKEVSLFVPGVDEDKWASAIEMRDYLRTIEQRTQSTTSRIRFAMSWLRHQYRIDRRPRNEQELAVLLASIPRAHRSLPIFQYHVCQLPDAWNNWTQQALRIIRIVSAGGYHSESLARSFLETAPTLALLLLHFYYLFAQANVRCTLHKESDDPRISKHGPKFEMDAAVSLVWELGINRDAITMSYAQLNLMSHALQEHNFQLSQGRAVSKTHAECLPNTVAYKYTQWAGYGYPRLDIIIVEKVMQDCGRFYGVRDCKALIAEIQRRMEGNELAGVQHHVRHRYFLSSHEIFKIKMSNRAS